MSTITRAETERERGAAGGSAPALVAEGLRKTYRLGRVSVPVLRGVDLRVEEGEWVAVLGASGSGKSTLLHLLGGLDRPDRRGSGGERGGEIRFRGDALGGMSVRRLDRYRNEQVGFVFQFYHLLPELTVLENVCVSAMIRLGRFSYMRRARSVRERASALLDSFGMSERLRHRPAELSGGERQRVALARALINEPSVLLADEPTGNLDAATGEQILDCIEGLRASERPTMVMVTHDAAIAARADRRVRLLDGRVVDEGSERG
jgi:lipoprotein-releasing system ATP-binding protein